MRYLSRSPIERPPLQESSWTSASAPKTRPSGARSRPGSTPRSPASSPSLRGARRLGRRERARRRAPRLGAEARLAAAGRASAGRGARRPRRFALAAGDLPRGVRARGRAGPAQPHRRDAARPDAASPSAATRRSGASCRRIVARRGDLVPGLLGAERGLRPRERADARAPRRRRVGDRRPEGLDLVGRVGGLVLRALPHRPGRSATHGLSYLLVPMQPAGRRDPPDPADHRRRRVLRGVLRRRAHRAGRTSSARRATAGRWRWARSRSSAASRRSASRCCSATSSRRSSRIARANGKARGPADPPAHRRRLDRPRDPALERAAHALGVGRRALARRR